MILRLKPELDAESVAIQALSHVAADAELLARFLSLTGIGPQTLRQAAREPAFLAQVLDFICADDAGLLAFAANAGIRPETVVQASQALAGRTSG